MNFDTVIGNPPYQVMDGGAQASAKPIYNDFVDASEYVESKYITIIMPSRWYAGGKGLDSFREVMISDKRISKLVDYSNSADCFPSLGNRSIKGGICYFLWDSNHNDKCIIKSFTGTKCTSVSTRFLKEDGCEIFIRDAVGVSILNKVKSKSEVSFANIVSPRKPFDFPTNFTAYKDEKTSNSQVIIYQNCSN
jgi:site-specific DNA-methyltransferase (adenine-specific)